MPAKPPRMRTVDVGVAPKVRRNPNVDPAERHRCQVCRQMRHDCVQQVAALVTAARWTCQPCLEAVGQIPLPIDPS